MVSIVDVAMVAGVSQATVSRVLGGKVYVAEPTRQRVLAAVDSLGYQPSTIGKALRSGRSNTIAFVVSDIAQGWYATLAKEIQKSLHAEGYDVLLFDVAHSSARLEEILSRGRSLWLRGIVLAVSDRFAFDSFAKAMRGLAHQGIPVLSVGRQLTKFGVASVVIDDRAASRSAVTHLAERGCRRIAYLNRIAASAVGQERYEGYIQGLAANGLKCHSELTWECTRFRFEGGYESMNTALERRIPCDGIVAGTDELALGAMAAVLDNGLRVPEDMAIIGFGGLDLGAYVRPSLTTLGVNVPAIADHVIELLQAEDASATRLVHRQLIARTSA